LTYYDKEVAHSRLRDDVGDGAAGRGDGAALTGAVVVAVTAAVLAILVATLGVTADKLNGVWKCRLHLSWVVGGDRQPSAASTPADAQVPRREVAKVVTLVTPDTSLLNRVSRHVDVVLCGSALALPSVEGGRVWTCELTGGAWLRIDGNGHLLITCD
jgi:hypothetical protein